MISLTLAQRSGRRITFTVSYAVHEHLIRLSTEQGRSVSNLCAYIVERGVELFFNPDTPS